MSNVLTLYRIILEPMPGERIEVVAKYALGLAIITGQEINLTFNDCPLVVSSKDETAQAIVQRYRDWCDARYQVGP